MTESISPFQIAVEDTVLEDLRNRLANTRWPEPETCTGWDQGIPLAYSQELAQYWANDYDWRRLEQKLNSWPNYKTSIDGQDIHFIHLNFYTVQRDSLAKCFMR